MASELATRTPLMQKQPHTTSIGQQLCTQSMSTPYPGKENGTPLCGTDGSGTFGGLSLPYNPGFRYQIRRPVESWKFVETRKQDGSLLYLCRVCSSSYKHKKSLNKHWKDKHADIPRPEGSQPEEDDEDGDDDGEESEEDVRGNSSQMEIENSENINPKWDMTMSKALTCSTINENVLTSLPTLNTMRRLSLPVKRPLHREHQASRISLIPNSAQYSRSPLQPLNRHNRKRLRTETPTRTPDHGVTNAQNMSQYTGTLMSSYGNLPMLPVYPIEPEKAIPDMTSSQHTVQGDIVSEVQPLDLSVLRQDEEVQDTTQQTRASATLDNSKKLSQTVDTSLLIGLLQTALNTLKSEGKKQTEGCVDKQTTFSRTSASLLFAIGTLLVALVDENKENVDQHPPIPSSVEPSIPAEGQQECSLPHSLPNNVFLTLASQPFISSSPLNHPRPPSSEDPGHRMMDNLLYRTHTYMQPLQDIKSLNLTNLPFSLDLNRNLLSNSQSNVAMVQPSYTSADHIEQPLSTYSSAEMTKISSPPVFSSRSSTEHAPDGSIACPVCKFDARWFSELRAHMVNHSGHRMFGCCYCFYRAKWKWDVAKHMRRCPLGRHVAHLSNEALLRIVRYHPPPVGDILYSYFPQDVFPGVGIDRPPPPPESDPFDTRIQSNANTVQSTKLEVSSTPPVVKPCSSTSDEAERPICSQSPPTLTPQEFQTHTPGDESPKGLIIVDADAPSPADPESSNIDSSVVQKVLDTSGIAVLSENTSTTGLVFRLRKCTQCAFCSSNEQELISHLMLHENQLQSASQKQ